MMFMDDLIVKFWARVNKDGPVPVHAPELGLCWTWTGDRMRRANGDLSYGKCPITGRQTIAAHRLAYLIEHPDGGLPPSVCHRCDNVACVRASHLFAGSQRDNVMDMMAKGRGCPPKSALGEAHYMAKLTAKKVQEARARYADGGITFSKLAATLGVHEFTVRAFIRGKTWKHAGGPISPLYLPSATRLVPYAGGAA